MESSRPIHVVVPVKDRLDLTASLVGQLLDQREHTTIWIADNGSEEQTRRWLRGAEARGDLRVIDAAGWGLHRMWNEGVRRALRADPDADVAILNNDLELGPSFLSRLQRGLHADDGVWAVSANYDERQIDGIELVTSTFKNGGLAGFAFMASAAAFAEVSFDEQLRWWYGDDDFVWQIEVLGGRVAVVGDALVTHLDGGSQTVVYDMETVGAIEADLAHALAKWFDPQANRTATAGSCAVALGGGLETKELRRG